MARGRTPVHVGPDNVKDYRNQMMKDVNFQNQQDLLYAARHIRQVA